MRKSGSTDSHSLSANPDATPRSAYLINPTDHIYSTFTSLPAAGGGVKVQRWKAEGRIRSATKGVKIETRASIQYIQHASSFIPNLELAPNQHSRPRQRDDSP